MSNSNKDIRDAKESNEENIVPKLSKFQSVWKWVLVGTCLFNVIVSGTVFDGARLFLVSALSIYCGWFFCMDYYSKKSN